MLGSVHLQICVRMLPAYDIRYEVNGTYTSDIDKAGLTLIVDEFRYAMFHQLCNLRLVRSSDTLGELSDLQYLESVASQRHGWWLRVWWGQPRG